MRSGLGDTRSQQSEDAAPEHARRDWRVSRLADVADFRLGKMLDGVKNKGYPRPYLANLNVRWGRFDLDDLREMRFEEHEIEKYGLRHGDIVMCEGGEPGRCALWKEQLPGMTIQKALHRIRPDACMSNEFMYYNLFYRGRAGRFAPLFTGATIKHLPRQQLAKVEVDVPPMAVQERIADILSAYDDLIENNRRRIALLEQAARELYREWFVRLRFPGHENTRIVDGLPAGWQRKTLREVAVTNAQSYHAKDLPETLNYIDISSVSAGRIREKKSMVAADAPGRARRKAAHGDVIWSNVRPNLKAYSLVLYPEKNDVFSTGFSVLSATRVPFIFLYQSVTSDYFVTYLVNHTTGVSYPAVRPDDFERAEIIVPAPLPLIEFHEICESKYHLIAKLVREDEQLMKARDLLLPRLMSGEVAV